MSDYNHKSCLTCRYHLDTEGCGSCTWLKEHTDAVRIHGRAPCCSWEGKKEDDLNYCIEEDLAESYAREKKLEEINSDLYSALLLLYAVIGLTAVKYESQRQILQEACDIASKALRKARGEADYMEENR